MKPQAKEALEQMMQKAGVVIPGQEHAMEPAQQLQNMLHEITVVTEHLAGQLQLMGQALDVSRLQASMICNILVDKGIITKEEFEEKYKTDVADKIKQMREEYEKKMKQAIEEHERQLAQQVVAQEKPLQETPDNSDAAVSHVVLPSEKTHKIRFEDK